MIILSTPAHLSIFFFFFNDTATTEIYTLSLHDALPISICLAFIGLLFTRAVRSNVDDLPEDPPQIYKGRDRKSTRLNSSHVAISYAVFCLKKKNQNKTTPPQ